jgi:hypothetical protein
VIDAITIKTVNKCEGVLGKIIMKMSNKYHEISDRSSTEFENCALKTVQSVTKTS